MDFSLVFYQILCEPEQTFLTVPILCFVSCLFFVCPFSEISSVVDSMQDTDVCIADGIKEYSLSRLWCSARNAYSFFIKALKPEL